MYMNTAFAVLLLAFVTAFSHAAYVPGKAFDRFITIWLENEDYTNVSTNQDFEALAKKGILLTSYYALTHPSQPNYMASVSGDYYGLDTDNDANVPANVSTVVDLFDTKGIAWKEYMESIPSPGYNGTSKANSSGHTAYVRKHNPLVSFGSITNNKTRLNQIVGFDQFEKDLSSRTLPQWAHMSPNITDDGHDTGLAYGLAWSRSFITPLLSNVYFTNRTLLLLTLDESATYSEPNKIASLLLGDIPSDLQGTKDDTFYTHYSILSTLENNFALPSLGRYDVGANVFELVANNQNVVDRASVHLNQSYPGYLNTGGHKAPIPTPNTNLTGAGGQGILASIANTWTGGSTACDGYSTPYDGSGNVFDAINPPKYKMVQNTNGNTQCEPQSIAKSAAYPIRPPGFWLVAVSSVLTVWRALE